MSPFIALRSNSAYKCAHDCAAPYRLIKHKTVFVLGAGAHMSYGFPSGLKLKDEVAHLLRNARNRDDGKDLLALVRLGKTGGKMLGYKTCHLLADNIAASGQPSIDAFLNNNGHVEGAGVFGKAAIAQVLRTYEDNKGVLPHSDDDWISYLIAEMGLGVKGSGIAAAKQFAEGNKVGFVTFNYDRFLEKTFLHRIIGSYGLDPTSALEILRSIEICHVFGTLGPLPYDSNPTDWVDATDRIKLIHEAEEANDEVAQARRMLREAHNICLLGFGYHAENVSLIDLPEAVKASPGFVGSSAEGLTLTEWTRNTSRFVSGAITRYDGKCLPTLKNLRVW